MTLSDELQVVLITSKSQLSKEDISRLQGLLSGGLDWTSIHFLSQRHKVFPRVWKNLSRYISSLIPEEVNAQQKNLMRRNFLISATMTKYLFMILDIFAKNNLTIIPYKGPVLASYLYNDITQRSYGDLDFLIRRDDFSKAYLILQENGYIPEIQLSSEKINSYTAIEDNLSFANARGVILEIHWELSGRYLIKPMGIDLVGQHLSSTKIHGRELSVFSDENLLIYFCLHGTKHCWEQLDLIACVSELLLKAERIDWQYVLEIVSEYRCRRILFVGILLAIKSYHVSIPEQIYRLISSDKKSVLLSKKLYEKMCVSDNLKSQQRDAETDPRYSSLRMSIRDSNIDILRYALRLFFVPSKSEWQAVNFPPLLVGMYFLIRPFRVLGAAIQGCIRRLSR